MKVKSIGDTALDLHEDVTLNNVLHVPDLGVNLLSVSKIVEKGNTVFFNSNGCTIKNTEGKVVAQVKADKGVYKLSEKSENCMMAYDSYTWHRRLGHLNFNSLKRMRDGAVMGVNFKDNGTKIQNCEICCQGKMCSYPFSSSETKTRNILEVVHSDISGPIETQSIGHARYFITFIDDFTKMVFIYFMKSQSEVLETFKKFNKFVENHTGKRIQNLIGGYDDKNLVPLDKNAKVKTLRSDNGAVYLSREFVNYCKANGIVQQLTNVYTPQQNGVAERMNRTLTEKARCLLFDAGLPKSYWAEAVNMAAYIINKSVNSCNDKTPEELWTGNKVDLSNMKTFGSEVMVHVPKEKRKKWDKRAEKMIFVGYTNGTKGYRCINPNTRKVTLSRDVKFLHTPEKVILNLNNDINKTAVEHQQDDSVIILDDTNDTYDYDVSSPFDDTDDIDYEPSNETLEEAEQEEADDERLLRKKKPKKVNVNPLNLTNYAFFVEP